MKADIDFRTLTERQLAEKLVASVGDLEDQHTAETLCAVAIVDEVNLGRAVIVTERDAIAVVRPEGYREVHGEAVLWLLYVKAESRCNGIGKAFVIDLRRRFEQSMPMILVCNGRRRETFFSDCGFCLKEQLADGSVVMQAKSPYRS